MEIINAHAHIYPTKIAKKATIAIGDFYGIQMETPEGTVDCLIKDGSKIGVTKYLVHSVATTAHQVRSINEFIKKEIDEHEEFIGFMTLHQDLTDDEIKIEVDWAIKNGFKGIKLHPDFQKFYIDEESAQRFYKIVGNRLPFLLHMGDDRYEFSQPERLVKMAKKYTEVKFIAAHFGGYRCWEKASIYKGLKNVYFDTCSSLAFISSEKAKEIIDLLGVEKFFFATDFPMWDAETEYKRFLSIPLIDEERQMILSKNIKKLLKIK